MSIEIAILPFSFSEYCEAQNINEDFDTAFSEYMQTGGFPYISVMDRTKEKVDMYLEDTYNTIIIKDIEDRFLKKKTESIRLFLCHFCLQLGESF